MPAKSQAAYKLMKAAENNPEFAEKVWIKPSVAKEFTKGNVGSKRFSKLKERIKRAKDNSK